MGLEFWKGKRVLVTGHTGFKGSWLSLWLQQLGATVIGFSLDPPSQPNLFNEANVSDLVEDNRGDISNLDALQELLQNTKPEIVFHLAAQSLVRESYASPIETFQTNSMGTANLLFATINCEHIKSTVLITSDKCYQNNEDNKPFVEDDKLGGKDPYSASKACAEIITTGMRNLGEGQAFASARAGNVIGGGDWGSDRLIPDLVKSFSKKIAVEIRNPNAVRPWQHVLDPLFGYLLLAECLWHNKNEFDCGWNFGPEPHEAKTVEWIADESKRLWGDKAEWIHRPTQGVAEAKFLRLDSTKSKTQLGWIPFLKAKESIEWTIDWYRRFYNNECAYCLCQEQLNLFEEKLSQNEL